MVFGVVGILADTLLTIGSLTVIPNNTQTQILETQKALRNLLLPHAAKQRHKHHPAA